MASPSITVPVGYQTPAPASAMAPAPVSAPAPHESGFTRFIDKVEGVFNHAKPALAIAENLAVAAEAPLALTPFGPEYAIAVNAIVGAQQVAKASIDAGVNLTGAQKMGIALSAAAPALNQILAKKGVNTQTETVIEAFIQSVFGIYAGPIAKTPVATSTTA